MSRILLTTYGSLGDLHPYVAIALGLRAQGHEAIVATSDCYRRKIESLGLGFRPIRPDSAFVTDPAAMARIMDTRWGLVRVGVEIVGPTMRDTYEDVLPASKDVDLLVSHPLPAYATRLVAEKTGIPWASTQVTPLGFLSPYDLPIVPVVPRLSALLRRLGPAVGVPLLRLNKRATRFLAGPWYRLRKEIGLPPARDANPLLDSHAPRLVLALFSPLLAPRQPDWPAQTVHTGFPLYDQNGDRTALPPNLERFLDDGPPPIVFTLGHSAARVAGGARHRQGHQQPPRRCGTRRRHRRRVRPVLPTVPPRRGRRPRGRHRHHWPGDARRPAGAGRPVRPRPTR